MAITYTLTPEPPTYSFAASPNGAWWTDKVDNDDDGARSSGVLNFDVNVSSGSHSVYAKIYYATYPSGSYSLYTQTSDFTITGSNTGDAEAVTIGYPGLELSGPTNYNFRIDIFETGTTSPVVTSLGNTGDDDLNAELFETNTQDQPPTYSFAASPNGAWWTDKVDNDDDGARSSGVLNFDVNVSSG
ncbi:MAG: choice-of-anchor H family protein, partial [Candidatus Zixiibacteriota bacterium]